MKLVTILSLFMYGVVILPSSFAGVLSYPIKKVAQKEIQLKRLAEFEKTMNPHEKEYVAGIVHKISEARPGIFSIGNSEPADLNEYQVIKIFVQGTPQTESGLHHEWYEPLVKGLRSKWPLYFFKLNVELDARGNIQLMVNQIQNLAKKFPKNNIQIFGHSAGGAISIMALNQMVKEDYNQLDRLYFHTMAAPISGYTSPKRKWVVDFIKLFVAPVKMDIGIGFFKELENVDLPNCTMNVTTKCDNDIHACEYEELPQIFYSEIKLEEVTENEELDMDQLYMPCEEVVAYPDSSHSSIIIDTLNYHGIQ